MDIGIVITQMVELFIMLGAGFVLVRTKVLQEDFIAGLNAFVLNITMPLLIIGSVETEIPDSMPLTDILLMTVNFQSILYSGSDHRYSLVRSAAVFLAWFSYSLSLIP